MPWPFSSLCWVVSPTSTLAGCLSQEYRAVTTSSEKNSPGEGPDFSKGDGLVPAIAQDAATGEVLMLAYMNAESYAETLATGRAVYFSRSRNKLWRKGRRERQRAAGASRSTSTATPTRCCSRSNRSAAPPATRATRVASSAR